LPRPVTEEIATLLPPVSQPAPGAAGSYAADGAHREEDFGGLAMLLHGNMAAGVAADDDLRRWADRGLSYARSLSPK
jgi:hypothetical protein